MPSYVDVSTVVTMLPYPLLEIKPGLIPERWKIPAAPDGGYLLFPVQRCFHPVYIDENRPRLIVPDPSDVVANSIVEDHKCAMLGYVHLEAEPGLAWVNGEYRDDESGHRAFESMHNDLLKELREMQSKWFRNLVAIADDDWARYRQHKFVTSLQRTAAMSLSLVNREWLLDHRIEEALSKCKFCFTQVHPQACICYSCHGILDMERYKIEFLGAGNVETVRPAKL